MFAFLLRLSFIFIFLPSFCALIAEGTDGSVRDYEGFWNILNAPRYPSSAQTEELQSFYKVVHERSKQRSFVRFRGRILASHLEYSNMTTDEIKEFGIGLIMSKIYLRLPVLYSETGGVSLRGVLVDTDGKAESAVRNFKFDGVYYTDLMTFGMDTIVYAYCTVPGVTNCIVLGLRRGL